MKTSLKGLAALGALAFSLSLAVPTLAQGSVSPGSGAPSSTTGDTNPSNNNEPNNTDSTTPGSTGGSTDNGVPSINQGTPNNGAPRANPSSTPNSPNRENNNQDSDRTPNPADRLNNSGDRTPGSADQLNNSGDRTPAGSTDTGVPGVNTNSPNNNLQTPGPGRLNSVPSNRQAASGTIDEIVRSSQDFELFNALLRVADSEGVFSNELAGSGNYTVFAPTDQALAALPPGTFKALVQPENRDLLVSVLENHIVRGKVTSADLASGQVRSMGGSSMSPVGGQGSLSIGNARIVGPDINAENGVIHAVDQVIVTPELQSRLGNLSLAPSVTPSSSAR